MDPEGKRAAIMDAGERLFAARGYAGATMADVAQAADVAVGSVYRLFPDKSALLASLHARMEQRFIDAMERAWRSEPDMRRRFRPMVAALMEEAGRQSELMPLYSLTRELAGSGAYQPGVRTIDAIEAMYAEGVRAGAFVRLSPRTAAVIGYGMVDAAMRLMTGAGSPSQRAAIVRDLARTFERGFLASTSE